MYWVDSPINFGFYNTSREDGWDSAAWRGYRGWKVATPPGVMPPMRDRGITCMTFCIPLNHDNYGEEIDLVRRPGTCCPWCKNTQRCGSGTSSPPAPKIAATGHILWSHSIEWGKNCRNPPPHSPQKIIDWNWLIYIHFFTLLKCISTEYMRKYI